MASQKMHRIVRPVLDVRVPGAQGPDVLDRIRSLWDTACVPALEAACEAVAPDETVRIDRLEMDLGTLSADALDTDLAERLRDTAVETLKQRVREDSADAGRSRWRQTLPAPVRAALRGLPPDAAPETTHGFESGAYLLGTGRRPWWSPSDDDLERVVRRLLDADSAACVALVRAAPPTVAASRLARQGSLSTLQRLVRRLGHEDAIALARVWTEALAVLHPDRDPAFLQTVVWDAVLRASLQLESGATTESVRRSVHAQIARTMPRLTATEAAVWTRRLRRLDAALRPPSVPGPDPVPGPDATTDDPGAENDPASPAASSSPEHSPSDAPTDGDDETRSPDAGRSPLADTEPPFPHANDRKNEGRNQWATPGDGLPEPPEETPFPAGSQEHPAVSALPPSEGPHPRADRTQPAEVAYVDDAGLVLLAPFLPPFFETLDLVRDASFVDLEAHGRAVLLTRFLATGAADSVEPTLALAARLCGWPASEPPPRRLTPTPQESAEASALLASVIEHWAVLKTTSAEGLRHTFLLRDGKLERQPHQWQLTVDRHGVDVLLESLPWGFSIVSLPWMPTPLFVSW
jgi:hypothetical protein